MERPTTRTGDAPGADGAPLATLVALAAAGDRQAFGRLYDLHVDRVHRFVWFHVRDGALAVDCPGGYHDWSACHAAAEARCGQGGYRVIGQTTNEGGAVGRGDWSREGSEVARTMEFRCLE